MSFSSKINNMQSILSKFGPLPHAEPFLKLSYKNYSSFAISAIYAVPSGPELPQFLVSQNPWKVRKVTSVSFYLYNINLNDHTKLNDFCSYGEYEFFSGVQYINSFVVGFVYAKKLAS